jgi:hypothetical protein
MQINIYKSDFLQYEAFWKDKPCQYGRNSEVLETVSFKRGLRYQSMYAGGTGAVVFLLIALP